MKRVFIIIMFLLSTKDSFSLNNQDEINLIAVSENKEVYDVCYDKSKYSLLTSIGLFVFYNGDIDTVNIAEINSQTKKISELSENLKINTKYYKLTSIDGIIYLFADIGFATIFQNEVNFIFYNILGVEDSFIRNLYNSENYLYVLFDGTKDLNSVLIFNTKSKSVEKVFSFPGLQNYFEFSNSRIMQYYDSDTNSTKFVLETLKTDDLILNNYEFKYFTDPLIKSYNDSFIVIDNNLNIYSIKNDLMTTIYNYKGRSELFRPSFEISGDLIYVSINDYVYKIDISNNKVSTIYKFDLKDNCRYGIRKLILIGNKLLLLINRFHITNYENCISIVFIDI